MVKRSIATSLTKQRFDEHAAEYDDSIYWKAPGYEEMHRVMLSLIPLPRESEANILELGVGTGTSTKQILERFPNIRLHGYDVSGNMLKQARAKLAPFKSRVKLYQQDFGQRLEEGRYQVIISAIAIHHVPQAKRFPLFQRLYQMLTPGGCLILSDVFSLSTQALMDRYDEIYRRELEAQGVDMKKYEEHLSGGKRSGGSYVTIGRYLRWLKRAGFVNVDCLWQNFLTALVYGEKLT